MNPSTDLAIDSLSPSHTHIQKLRRERFDAKLLQELADSIKGVGVVQPIVVRAIPDARPGKFEIVVGERRWLASKKAGLTTIPVTVRELSDDQVLEVQLIENLQRENLHELEEAEGYEELMKLKKINADAVADMVGRSRSYVFRRTKLLSLCPEARKAFYAGALDASRALLIARIGHHDTQRAALKDLEGDKWRGPMSYRQALEHIQNEYMLKLKDAPFDIADTQLLPKAGSCQACPKRTGNQKELFADVKNGDVCTDPKCFDEKRQAIYFVAVKKLQDSGRKVLYGDAAKKIFPHWKSGSSSMAGGYLEMNSSTYVNMRPQKVADIVGSDYDPILVQHPASGKIIAVATQQAVAKASHGPKSRKKSTSPKASKGPDVDAMLTDRLAQLIHKNAPKQFGKAWLLDLTCELYEKLSLRNGDAVAAAWGWPRSAFRTSGYRSRLPAQAAKLGERDLVLLMFHLIFAVGPWSREGVLKLFNIKEPQVRSQIIAERKAAAKALRESKRRKP